MSPQPNTLQVEGREMDYGTFLERKVVAHQDHGIEPGRISSALYPFQRDKWAQIPCYNGRMPKGRGPQFRDLSGERFGRLVVVKESHSRRGSLVWECSCDCGGVGFVMTDNLKSGNTTSCGCYHRERQRAPKTHGRARTREHQIWILMRQRCMNPNNPAWKNYGGRGIQVCDRWSQFAAFLEDMGQAPKNKTLDRIDNDGDYEPSNCRWATRAEQSRNTRRNVRIRFRGRVMPLVDWAPETGLAYDTLRSRLDRGWNVERALTTPVGGR